MSSCVHTGMMIAMLLLVQWKEEIRPPTALIPVNFDKHEIFSHNRWKPLTIQMMGKSVCFRGYGGVTGNEHDIHATGHV